MVRIAVCGQMPTITGILRRDTENQITEYRDGALLGLKLGQGTVHFDLILVQACCGEGLPPMETVTRAGEPLARAGEPTAWAGEPMTQAGKSLAQAGKSSPVVYLMAEPPGNVAKIELSMLLKELREKKKEKEAGRMRETRTAEADCRGEEIQNEKTI